MTSNVSHLVKVKSLEWVSEEGNESCLDADGCGKLYRILVSKNGSARLRMNASRFEETLYATVEEAKSAAQADYESRILAALTPAEQCFSVKEGYEVNAYRRVATERRCGMVRADLSEALTIRPAEDVRREAIREALMWKLTKVGHPADNPAIIALVDKEVNEMIDTPQPKGVDDE